MRRLPQLLTPHLASAFRRAPRNVNIRFRAAAALTISRSFTTSNTYNMEQKDGIDRDTPYNDGSTLAQQLQNYRRHSSVDVWGFAIYRCSYDSESDWQTFIAILNERARGSLNFHSTPELFEKLDWAVQSDPSTLDGATRDTVRARFRNWVAEQTSQLPDPQDINVTWNQRFRYCIYVDATVLESVVKNAPRPPQRDLAGVGCVDVISKEWDERAAQEEDEEEEDIEGYKTYDVGWMKVSIDGLVPRIYMLLGEDPWSEIYQRPPAVVIE